ncbi:L-sorbose 1-phosphate reductase [Spiroplasma chinense]|uniref:L-sorbose 1-phosphate reductase n=1 Tax=Spiroplasma chinense TaxID=216932 RepID=A0A5B9Y3A6_9MOLU|nr:zinc-binding dehydrogenase [Spiroplasma chinense]QEH61461.1 L-sorbose 1-phosphate reductase [Spiroplasma chinense]
MKSKLVRLYGKNDLRIDEIELPKIKENEILASVITDSICMSSYKLAAQGENHKKTPENLKENPIVVGHEFCGEIIEVGEKWKNKFKAGQKYVVQANLQLENEPWCPGYSYPYTGGGATHIIIDKDVMEQDCLIPYNGDTYFEGSLVEPLSCIIGAFKANYHLIHGTYNHKMGIKEKGNLLILGGTGPMGLIAIDYALHGPIKPSKIVVTDLEQSKLDRAKQLYLPTSETEIEFINVNNEVNSIEKIKKLSSNGYDDIFVMVPSKNVVETASKLCAPDGCINFFAGPQDKEFTAELNFYDVHYNFTHVVGTSGGNTEDVRDGVKLIEEKKVDLSKVVTHILGLDSLAETTMNQPAIGGGKKLVYTTKKMKLTSLNTLVDDNDNELKKILDKNNGLWCKEAEDFVLSKWENII